MNIIVDTNIFIAALLKNGKIRELIVNSLFTFFVPEVIYDEIIEHKKELIEKSGLSEDSFNELSSIISKYINIIPDIKTLPYKSEAERIISKIDKDDVPIIAASLSLNSCPIWTDDSDFIRQNAIKTITTKEMIGLS